MTARVLNTSVATKSIANSNRTFLAPKPVLLFGSRSSSTKHNFVAREYLRRELRGLLNCTNVGRIYTRTSSIQLSIVVFLYILRVNRTFFFPLGTLDGITSIKLNLRTALMHQLITSEMYLDTFYIKTSSPVNFSNLADAVFSHPFN